MVTRTTAPDAPADPLDELAAEAESLGRAAKDDGTGAQAPAADLQPLSNAQCLAMAIQMVRETLCVVAKVESPRKTLDDATAQGVADALAPVLTKYGINLSAVAGDYMIELRAAMVTIPVIMAARTALIEEIRAKRAKPIEPEPAPAEAAGQ